MPVAKIPDAEFVELWKTHGSGRKIAEVLGIDPRAVYNRRRRLESKYHFPIEANKHTSGQTFDHLQPKTHTQAINLGIEDGVVIVFSDAHFQLGERTPAFRALLMLIEALQPRAVFNNGDAFDGASISRYPRINWDSQPGVLDELRACEANLGEVEETAKAANSKVKLIWPLGNHDARYEMRLAANVPQFQGVRGFSLKDHFPEWTPCWSAWVNDGTVIKHRYKNGLHATHLNTLHSGKNIVTGHLHSLRVTPFNDYSTHTRYGVDTGTLANPAGSQFMDYLEQSPTNWRSGFAVLTFHKGNLLWPEIVKVHEGDFVEFRGSVFKV